MIFDSILKKLIEENHLTIEMLSLDQNIIEKINKFASIKYVFKKIEKNDEEKLELLQGNYT